MSKTPATEIYVALMDAIEQRRVELGFPMERFSEFAGLPERYFSKALHVDTASGRQASWLLMQAMIGVLFPDGLTIEIKAQSGPRLSQLMAEFNRRYPPKRPTYVDARARQDRRIASGNNAER